MTPGDGAIARAIGRRFPIAGAILETLGPSIIDEIRRQPADRPLEEAVRAIAPAVERIAESHPEIANQMNLESPLRSGTTLGMGGALLTALGALAGLVRAGNWDPAVMGPLVATVLASLFGLWRRWAPNLRPLFTRR